MAVIGTAGGASTMSPGPWCEVGTAAFAAAVTLSASAVTAHTVILPAVGEGSNFNPLLPIACSFPAGNTIQGSSNSGLPASCGVGSVTVGTASPSTVTINFLNVGAAASITAGTRMLLVQQNGI